MITFSTMLNFSPNTSYACSCVVPGTAKEELKESAAVFSGKVINIAAENKFMLFQSSADPIAVTFEVQEWWKGNVQKKVTVYTAKSSASCGFEFALNNKYLVYANEVDGTFKVSVCSRTALLSTAGDDLAELGKGEKPTKQLTIGSEEIESEEQLPSKSSINYQPIYIFSIVIGILLIALYITRRIKKK